MKSFRSNARPGEDTAMKYSKKLKKEETLRIKEELVADHQT
jgi:hypothetical protein